MMKALSLNFRLGEKKKKKSSQNKLFRKTKISISKKVKGNCIDERNNKIQKKNDSLKNR